MDQALLDEGNKSWYSFIDQSVKKLSIPPDDMYAYQASQFMLSSYVNEISNNLKTIRRHGNDNKLCTFSYVYNEFRLQSYLSLSLPKQITKELTKMRISSHDLLIEKGRYFRPKISRNDRKCSTCQVVEDEEHFMLFCNKFSNLRLDLLTKLDIPTDYQGLKPNSYESITLLNKLLNPQTIDNVKLISYFISSALSLLLIQEEHLSELAIYMYIFT